MKISVCHTVIESHSLYPNENCSFRIEQSTFTNIWTNTLNCKPFFDTAMFEMRTNSYSVFVQPSHDFSWETKKMMALIGNVMYFSPHSHLIDHIIEHLYIPVI